MSLKNPKNLVVVGVVVALLAGTVLLAGYTSIRPAGTDSSPQVKACQVTGVAACSAAGAKVAACAGACGAERATAGCCGTSCTEGCTKTCCAEQGKGCCAKSCAEGCTKPCCAEEDKSGCSGEKDAEAQ